MADIFVSYAKTDRPLASKLVAMLEAEGWSVWWDTSLGAADLYRDEIMKQLVAARAVITIWTPNSIRSDWVRAEAGAAKKEGKLIPVKTPDVAYADIPLPFGEMHTENVGSTELIRAAVVAQLAKPAVEPSSLALLTKGFKYELLTWWGIIGGALTLFGAISATRNLAGWAQFLVENWKEWTHAFWVGLFGWLGIQVAPEWTPLLSFLLFGSLLIIGQAIKCNATIKTQPATEKYRGKSFQLISGRTLLCTVLMLIGTILWLPEAFIWAVRILPSQILPYVEAHHAIVSVSTIVMLFVPQLIILVLFARHRLYAAVTGCLMALFFTIITLVPQSQFLSQPFRGYPW